MDCLKTDDGREATALTAVAAEEFDGWLGSQGDTVKAWLSVSGFKGKAGATCLIPGADGDGARALMVHEGAGDLWSWGGAAQSLPAGTYRIEGGADDASTADNACLGWALGCYRFDRYKKNEDSPRILLRPTAADATRVDAMASGIYLTRDLVNTPASDMGPAELAGAAEALAAEFGGTVQITEGDALLSENFPMIHAVGRASDRAPRLVDLSWGDTDHPGLTLVGKGVCFDTGGLDLKSAGAMQMMKKDMGGAAQVLGLARMIMASNLPVRLRVLIPAVENSVSSNAFRPLDILDSRKGITVEIGNTDAEGRLVLGDALTLACEEAPALLIDFATLTGAARVALGTDLPAMFSNDDGLAADLLNHGVASNDPIWRLPLHKPYRKLLDSKIADTNNISPGGFGGAITAALFLEKFVAEETPWAHFDLMSWNTSSKPGRPEGGEAQAIRGVFSALCERFG